jgi:hypothetical protein
MDKRIKSIIEKRKKLGWSIATLAAETNIDPKLIIFMESQPDVFKNILADWKKIINKTNAILVNAIDTKLAIPIAKLPSQDEKVLQIPTPEVLANSHAQAIFFLMFCGFLL